MPKQTTLGDNAEIYQPRKELTEKEKLRDMPFKKRVAYLWEYYRLHAFIAIAAIAFVSYIIYGIVTPDVVTKFYAAIVNSPIDPKEFDTVKTDFEKQLQLDPKTEDVMLNSNFYFQSPEDNMQMQQALVTYIATGQVDVIIAPESYIQNYASKGFLCKLSDQLPTDLYSSLTNDFYLSSTEDDPEKNVYGIYMKNSDLYKNHDNSKDPYVLGILANTKHTDNSIEFIHYLFKSQINGQTK